MFFLRRYFNLINNFSNWQEYFRYKTKKLDSLKLISRKKGIEFIFCRESMGVFKEIFPHDFYNINLLNKISSSSPTILDIGANVGYFTLLANIFFNPKVVLCFEPVPGNFSSLVKNLEFDKKKINKTFQLAVFTPETKNIELFVDAEEKITVTASHYKNISSGKMKLTCDCTDISQIIEQNKLDKIDILKMDCEGSEYDILYSLTDKYWNKISVITMEVHEIDSGTKNLKALTKFIADKIID